MNVWNLINWSLLYIFFSNTYIVLSRNCKNKDNGIAVLFCVMLTLCKYSRYLWYIWKPAKHLSDAYLPRIYFPSVSYLQMGISLDTPTSNCLCSSFVIFCFPKICMNSSKLHIWSAFGQKCVKLYRTCVLLSNFIQQKLCRMPKFNSMYLRRLFRVFVSSIL